MLTAVSARAETPCPVPAGMDLPALSLPAAQHATAAGQLTILTLGGAQTAGTEAGDRSATYPARLEAALRETLPAVKVTVTNEALPGNTAADVPAKIPALLATTGARLVIWGPGGGDAARRIDPTGFQDAVRAGIEAVRAGGADLILLDPPFMPAPERMARIEPYRLALRGTAAEAKVPVLARHDLMRFWNDNRILNLTARDDAERQSVARHLFACLARHLATPIAKAVR